MAREFNNPSSRISFGCGDRGQRFTQQVEQSLGCILVVDDDEAFCYAGAKALRMAGFKVLLAPDHRLALQILEGIDPIDQLITGIVMPNRVNGFALARMGQMARPNLKVLYLTAFEESTDEAIGPVLRKPIPFEALVAEARLALATCGEKGVGPRPSTCLGEGQEVATATLAPELAIPSTVGSSTRLLGGNTTPLFQAAELVIEAIGDDAASYAVTRAKLLYRRGDVMGGVAWRRVAPIVKELQRRKRRGHS